MKVAVTTANGALGSKIIKALINEIGHNNVIGIARKPEKASHLGVEIRKGDYSRKEDFDVALKDIDVLLLISGMDHPDTRVVQHKSIIDAAKENSVRKIVYTSIIGKEGDSTFDPIIKSNRQTENDIQTSGLEWIIGRNGLYIEPDLEYIDTYREFGKVANCAGDGMCSYTTREELAGAYVKLIQDKHKNGKIYELAGDAITQKQLAAYLNSAFGANLEFEDMSVEDYLSFQKKVNGEFLGPIIAGIYAKIRKGEFQVESDYEAATGRKHTGWTDYFKSVMQV